VAVAYAGHCWGREQRDELRALARACAVPVTLIVVTVPEAVARERLRANRHDPQRHDVPDALFARAVAPFEPLVSGEEPWCYDGATPLAAWVAALP
jgi:predicted kinase